MLLKKHYGIVASLSIVTTQFCFQNSIHIYFYLVIYLFLIWNIAIFFPQLFPVIRHLPWYYKIITTFSDNASLCVLCVFWVVCFPFNIFNRQVEIRIANLHNSNEKVMSCFPRGESPEGLFCWNCIEIWKPVPLSLWKD